MNKLLLASLLIPISSLASDLTIKVNSSCTVQQGIDQAVSLGLTVKSDPFDKLFNVTTPASLEAHAGNLTEYTRVYNIVAYTQAGNAINAFFVNKPCLSVLSADAGVNLYDFNSVVPGTNYGSRVEWLQNTIGYDPAHEGSTTPGPQNRTAIVIESNLPSPAHNPTTMFGNLYSNDGYYADNVGLFRDMVRKSIGDFVDNLIGTDSASHADRMIGDTLLNVEQLTVDTIVIGGSAEEYIRALYDAEHYGNMKTVTAAMGPNDPKYFSAERAGWEIVNSTGHYGIQAMGNNPDQEQGKNDGNWYYNPVTGNHEGTWDQAKRNVVKANIQQEHSIDNDNVDVAGAWDESNNRSITECAPGVDLTIKNATSGSQASMIYTGAINKIMRIFPWMTRDQIRESAMNSTRVNNNRNFKEACSGWGFFDVNEAVQYAKYNYPNRTWASLWEERTYYAINESSAHPSITLAFKDKCTRLGFKYKTNLSNELRCDPTPSTPEIELYPILIYQDVGYPYADTVIFRAYPQ